MAGVIAGSQFGDPNSYQGTNNSLSPTSMFGNPATFTAAANKQAGDYDTIMKGYSDLASKYSANPITSTNVTPQTTQYTQAPNATNLSAQTISAPQNVAAKQITPEQYQYNETADTSKSLADLSDLATTGGYSAQGIADIRARDIAPTRSIYASGNQNLQRNKALGGGYSPNYAAASAQMARDESNQIANVDTAANAGIAQNVAANRLAASGVYAGAAGAENAARTGVGEFNTTSINNANAFNSGQGLQADEFNSGNQLKTSEANQAAINAINEANASRTQQGNQFNAAGANRTNEFNASNDLTAKTGNASRDLAAQEANRQGIFSSLEGQRSLYGTNPALVNTFGNQVVQAGQLGQGQQQINNQRQRDVFGSLTGW